MLKANALFYAICIMLVIAMLCSIFILYAYLKRSELLILEAREQLNLNIQSAINLLSSPDENFEWEVFTPIDLFGEGKDSVLIYKKKWGVFELASLHASIGKLQDSRQILFGSKPSGIYQSALYLVDNNKPLSLCGSTVIKGNCYLPKSGVKRAYIEGQNFVGKELIQGTVKQSENKLPMPDQTILNYIHSLPSQAMQSSIEDLSDSLFQSFSMPTTYYHSTNSITLDHFIKGNIIIVSNTGIQIRSNAKLEDIILFAPEITIDPYFEGNLQIFATKNITVGSYSKFSYPSALILASKDQKENTSLTINSYASIKGMVMAFAQVNTNSTILIDQHATIEGSVYTNNTLIHKGTVYGNVICNKFLLQTPSSIYDNHLLNAVIDYSKLPGMYLGAINTENVQSKGVVKWMY